MGAVSPQPPAAVCTDSNLKLPTIISTNSSVFSRRVNGNAQNNQKNFHQKSFLRSFFSKKRPPASLTRLLRNQLRPQALGVFFVSFLLRLLCQKKAEFRIVPYKIAVNLQK